MYPQSVPALISKNVGNSLTNYTTWNGIIYNVKVYGAKGDGVADDTAAVQAAINAAIAASGSLVFFPPGTYKVTTLTNTSTISFVGDNATFSGYSGTIQKFGYTTLNNKNTATPVYNVIGYGAKGDGVADDSAAIAAAFTAAAVSGGIVFFPPGTYLNYSTIVKKSNVGIKGSGRFNTMIQHKGTGDCITMIETGPNYISHNSIEDIYINSTGIGAVGVNIQYVQNFTMRNVTVYGFQRQGVLLNFGIMCTFVACSIFSNGAIGYAQVEIGNSTTTTLFLNTYIAGGINIGTGGTIAGLRCHDISTLHFIGGAIEGTGVNIQLTQNCSAMSFRTDLEGPFGSYIEMGYGAGSTTVGNITNITIDLTNFESGASTGIQYGIKMKNCSKINISNNFMNIPTASLIANIWLEGTTNNAIMAGMNTIIGGTYLLINGVAPVSAPTSDQMWTSMAIVSDADIQTSHSNFNGGSSGFAGTAGDLSFMMDDRGTIKRVMVVPEGGYKNNTTPVVITFPVAFSTINAVVFNNTGLTVSVTLTQVTITTPNSTTVYSGVITIEGK